MSEDFKSRGPELLVDLSVHVAHALVELLETDAAKANHVGKEVANRMAAHWGGQNIYFPMGLSYRLLERDRQIYNEFTGYNHSELARKYGVSLQWIYRIVERMRKLEVERRQGDLFNGESDDTENGQD